jgi:hypothetical protein
MRNCYSTFLMAGELHPRPYANFANLIGTPPALRFVISAKRIASRDRRGFFDGPGDGVTQAGS